jgi:hypothetical protein
MPTLVASTTVSLLLPLPLCLSLCCLTSAPLSSVYHVTENGWVQVWSGDTTPMYYEYYPLKAKKQTESGGEEEMKVVS